MGQALYRKYRSRAFTEVVGQEHITETLEKALKSGKISHAYLFSGPRGVGKTSVARILAHEVNQLPYKDDSLHIDIIEIDAASNRRIDEIRDLRDRVRVTPTSTKYKVYIVDEVHMLTKEAFNALLKTLEEPPAHCIFILATTEPHKLPETIISRTQRFNFKPIAEDRAINHLEMIAKREGIDIEPEALALLAQHGEGSFRDSISLLDQLSSNGRKISLQAVLNSLGLPPQNVILELAQAIESGDPKTTLLALEKLRDQGANAPSVAKMLGAYFRQQLVEGKAPSETARFLRQLLEVGSSGSPFEDLEIAALEAAAFNSGEMQPAKQVVSQLQTATNPTSKHNIATKKPAVSKPTAKPSVNFDLEQWSEALESVKQQKASLYTALRLAQPTLRADRLVLTFRFPLHLKKAAHPVNIKLVEECIHHISGAKLAVVCELKAVEDIEPDDTSQPIRAKTDSAELDTISNIFGSAEVLES